MPRRRALGMAVGAEDQLRLCDVLASVFAIDPESAAAYDHLAATHPEALRPEHAWIYCQAAHQHGLKGQCDLDMFARTFRDAEHAAQFYGQRGWDFEAVEFTYLERAAKGRPGRFPEELGPDYADRGISRLLARSRRQEEEGNADAALATAEVLLALAPQNVLAHDRVARLCYQRGDLDRAAALLAAWHALEPSNPLPLAPPGGRRGTARQRGRTDRGPAAALDLTHGAAAGRHCHSGSAPGPWLVRRPDGSRGHRRPNRSCRKPCARMATTRRRCGCWPRCAPRPAIATAWRPWPRR